MNRVGMIALCLVFGMVVVTSVGCMKCGGNASQRVNEKAIEGAVKMATGGRASINVGSNIDLSGLPTFLQYPGANAKASWSMNNGAGSGTVYTFLTNDPAALVIDFYKKALAGWKNASTMESGDATVLIYGTEDEKQAVTITVAKDKESNGTSLTLLYSKKD